MNNVNPMLLLANVLSIGLVYETPVTGNTVWLIFTRFVSNLTKSGNLRASATDYAQIWHVGVTRRVLFHPEFQHARYIIFHLAGKDRRDNRIFYEIWYIVEDLIKSPIITKFGVQKFACFLCSFTPNFSSIG